jgi:glycosyltransferase involved in cell wall biosynthesis
MSKPKLLIWSDFVAPTGFANVAKNLFDDLHKEFQVSIVGINYHGDRKYDTDKYFVYSVSRDDMLGIKRLPSIIKRENPDVLLLFQDIFYISDNIKKFKESLKKEAKTVIYFPVDGSPFSVAWKDAFTEADAIITYSDWAIRTIRDKVETNKKIHKLYHGVNTDVFKPLDKQLILNIRKSLKWEGKFVAININRFQPRKAIPLSARAFSMFAKGYKVCKCGQHMPLDRSSCDLNMCPPEDIVDIVEHNRKDVFLYLHMMPQEASMGPGRANLLQNHLINAGFEDSDANTILGMNNSNIYNHEITEEQLNQIYNAANINISSTLGEGCGLSLLESAATGTPSIAPRNSAIPEVLNGTGKMINNVGLMNQALDNGHLRPIVDPWLMAKAWEEEYLKWKELGEEKTIDQACLDNINNKFLWQDKRDLLLKILKDTINNG